MHSATLDRLAATIGPMWNQRPRRTGDERLEGEDERARPSQTWEAQRNQARWETTEPASKITDEGGDRSDADTS